MEVKNNARNDLTKLEKEVRKHIRDKIWAKNILRAMKIDKYKFPHEVEKTIDLFEKAKDTREPKIASKLLWELENEMSLIHRAARFGARIVGELQLVKNTNTLMGAYLAIWSRTYGRHALVLGIRESVEQIPMQPDLLQKYAGNIEITTYGLQEDKEFAKSEILRICTLTETKKDCINFVRTLDTQKIKMNPIDAKTLAMAQNTIEYSLSTFFSIQNASSYIIHERVLDPLLSKIESMLPNSINTPSKVLEYVKSSPQKEIITAICDAYLEVLP